MHAFNTLANKDLSGGASAYDQIIDFPCTTEIERSCRERWVEQAQMFDSMAADHTGLLMIYDTVANEFIYISGKACKITGHEPQQYMGKKGMLFSLSNIHPSYQEGTVVLIKKLFCIRMALGNRMKNPGKFSASLDYMFCRSDGSYFHNMQLCIEAESLPTGEPTFVLNYHFDVSHLKKRETQTLIVNTSELIYIFHYDLTGKKLIEIKPVTKSEITILSLLAAGKQSKQIALETHNSPHTIDTHRRHLLSKLNCVDTTALIHYAKMTGII